MVVSVELSGRAYKFDSERGHDLSIPIAFEGPRLRAFGAEPPSSKPYRVGDFELDVKQGAGCNCEVFRFSAHLHGTHTECVGHISARPLCVHDVIEVPLYMLAKVVSVTPTSIGGDTYHPKADTDDLTLTESSVGKACADWNPDVSALIIRTTPNLASKQHRDYNSDPPAFLSNEAMAYITKLGVRFLLVDLPSVDRAEDEGSLSNHHIFWGIEQGSHEVGDPSPKSITELIYVPSEVKDGHYILQLQLANIRSDAAPSRPILYEVMKS